MIHVNPMIKDLANEVVTNYVDLVIELPDRKYHQSSE